MSACFVKIWNYARGVDVSYNIPDITRDDLFKANNQINESYTKIQVNVQDYVEKLTGEEISRLANRLNFSKERLN